MIPTALSTALGLRRPLHEKVRDYVHGRLNTELAELKPVAIVARLKTDESIYHKLQTGRYASIDDLDDLVAFKVVLLHRKQLAVAQKILEDCGLTTPGPIAPRPLRPTDFGYHEPKVAVMPPADYLARNGDVAHVKTEVQFTTALQHALDMATHGFDYKGSSYSWGRFRLVAQLRGTLELVDQILDDMEMSAVLASETPDQPPEFESAGTALATIQGAFDAAALPSDLRRMTDSVLAWTAASGLAVADLEALLARHQDLITAYSVDPTAAVLGALLRERSTELLENYVGRFYISAELESLCHESGAVPSERRVELG